MGESFGKLRLFTALRLPARVCDYLAGLAREFPCLRFTRNFHVTLVFIGMAPGLVSYERALDGVSGTAFKARISGAGFFRHGILWARVERCGELCALKSNVERELAKLGFMPEKRAFFPHVTLARFPVALLPKISAKIGKVKKGCEWKVDSWCLFRSTLNPEGAIHEIVREYKLENSCSDH